MSTSSLAVSLLLLSLLLSEAQGIRLEKGFISVTQQQNNNNLQEEETGVMKRSNNIGGPGESSSLCKDGGTTQCSSGSTRKLISMTSFPTTTTTTTTTSKNEKNGRNDRADHAEPEGEMVNGTEHGGEEGNSKPKSSVISKHQEAVSQHYPDFTDLTEMDYSPARRKPPIHN